LLPEKFIERIQRQLGNESGQFFNALSETRRFSIRLNPRKLKKNPALEQVPWCEGAYYLKERPVYTLDPRLHCGAYYVQEASSMFLQRAWRQIRKELSCPRVLDVCAAPGGKSTLLAAEIGEDGFLVANEVIRSRAQVLKENLTKWGSSHVLVTNNDPADFSKLEASFDVIVADVPCSGEGLFRKDVHAREEWSDTKVQLCSARQRRILSDILPALRKDGFLIYSTCTFSEEENEENISWLSSLEEWEGIDLHPDLSWGLTACTTNGIPSYRFYPHKCKGEGFFICVLRKKSGKAARPVKPNQKLRFFKEADKKSIEKLRRILPGNWFFLAEKQGIHAVSETHAAWIDELYGTLRPVKPGIYLGELTGNDFRPSHELAMYSGLNPGIFPSYDCSLKEALRYLKKEDIKLTGQPEGWVLLRFEGASLGFVKNIGSRCNNYYPKDWRILMPLPEKSGDLLF
jgi:16S rRNA C967 or C1407 C5-methylase (RsmB/RsmF family)/NOL1/NOP2/fmu family ribosome biogenesis protein